jgi:hypothetical protein
VTHAPLEPFARGMLPVAQGNEIYWETSGNPDGEADGHGGVESMEEMARAKGRGFIGALLAFRSRRFRASRGDMLTRWSGDAGLVMSF